MLFEIDTHSGIPIYRQIMDQVTQQILTGQLIPDDPLPSVRDLAAQLNVNPMTISKAYGYLEQSGLVTRQRGIGMTVAPIPSEDHQATKNEILEDLLRKAAVTAVQLGIDEDLAVERFRELFVQYMSKTGRPV